MNLLLMPLLALSRSRLMEALLDSATDYAIIANRPSDGLVTSWNEGAHRILSWTEKKCSGNPPAFSSLWRTMKGTQLAEMQNALDLGRGNDERWHQKKDGSSTRASDAAKDENGTAQGFLKILRDRTEQRGGGLEAQRADAEFLHSVLASSGSCIKVLDLNANVVFLNEGGLRALEVSDFDTISQFAIGRVSGRKNGKQRRNQRLPQAGRVAARDFRVSPKQ